MMNVMSTLKYNLLLGLLIWTLVARGQRVEIFHQGEEPIWLSEQHLFVWDKVIPLHFEEGKSVYVLATSPSTLIFKGSVFNTVTET